MSAALPIRRPRLNEEGMEVGGGRRSECRSSNLMYEKMMIPQRATAYLPEDRRSVRPAAADLTELPLICADSPEVVCTLALSASAGRGLRVTAITLKCCTLKPIARRRDANHWRPISHRIR